jgi:hypothetical protein
MFALIKKIILQARLWFYRFMCDKCIKEAKKHIIIFEEWMSDSKKYLDKAAEMINQLNEN